VPRKKKKPKPPLPRRVWQINPVTRVKESDKKYSRATARSAARKAIDEE
jgi:hypothetical protein